jgi:hypothetical protein
MDPKPILFLSTKEMNGLLQLRCKVLNRINERIIIPILLVTPFLMGATHEGPAYDTRPRNALDAFAKDLAKKHRLEFLNSGLGSLADAREGIWAINLVSGQKLTLEQARKFAADLSYQLLYKIYQDPLFAQYCKKAAYMHKSAELKDEYVGFRLAFWDENTNRPLYPFIAQIRLADGNLYYHYADPKTQALQEPIVESLTSLELPNYQLTNVE